MQAKNITKFIKGLFRSSSYEDQPKDSYSFALNAVSETDQADNNKRSNEESNDIDTFITPGFIPIGKEYINNDRVIIFSVSADDSVSEIGIFFQRLSKYVAHVNDSSSLPKDKLNFKVQNQIQATYRLRGGCEDTVYWVDGNNNSRYFNFQKPQQFQNQAKNWVASKFNLQRTYNLIPEIEKVDVLDSGGNILPGSYSFALSYLDDSMNPTEWPVSSPSVKIYHDLFTEEYGSITGSINSNADYIAFGPTNKSIRIEVGNLDASYTYYRIAIIVQNSGTGVVNAVYYTEPIPIQKTFYIFTGENYTEKGLEEDIAQFQNIIESPDSIEQSENILYLANTKGPQVKLDVFQKYASRIKVDCVIKKVFLNDIQDPANTKNPTHEFNGGVGYMPREIYSVGIVYIMEGNQLTPVYHIPGKPLEDAGQVYAQNVGEVGNPSIFPMSVDNASENSTYTQNESCNAGGLWGRDCAGIPLLGKPVRHHRFPSRTELGIPLITNNYGTNQESKFYSLELTLTGELKLPIPCPENTPECTSDVSYIFNIKVEYKVAGEDFFFTSTIDPNSYADGESTTIPLNLVDFSQYHGSNDFPMEDIVVTISNLNEDFVPITAESAALYFAGVPTYATVVKQYTSTTGNKTVTSHILGFSYTNIERPIIEGGPKVIGYYIVRNERTEFEKTILDSAVLFPTVEENKYVAHGLLQPESDKLSKNIYAVVHPEHKFNQKEYASYDKLILEGNFNIKTRKYGKINYDDVYDGTSWNDKQKKGNDDGHSSDGSPTSRGLDGWSFNLISRDNILDYQSKPEFEIDRKNIKEIFYLDALAHKSVDDSAKDVYNISADNKIGMIQFKDDIEFPAGNNLPYVTMYKKNRDPYANFRLLPYYKEGTNPSYFKDDISLKEVFSGDAYISPMRYVSTVFWDNRVAERVGKKSVLKMALGIIVIIAGAVLAFFTGGASLLVIGAGISLIGAGVGFASSGLKQQNFNRAYMEEYAKGLRQTVLDKWVDAFYNYRNNPYTQDFGYSGNGGYGKSGPSDDTLQWAIEAATDLWFESGINMNLRNEFLEDVTPTFLYSPGKVESGNDTPLVTWEFHGKFYTTSNSTRYPVSSLERHGARKLLVFDEKRDDNRYYLGVPIGEYYNVNPDYYKKNSQKVFFHLPLEYDACLECTEEFPHRVHYSQQSFQEELNDNFRIFLPNNYRDIEGNTGVITNIFRLGNNLFIHTEEALWLVPRNYQERVTDQIVSFIGTGELFSIPPRQILEDSTGHSAGSTHKWATQKVPGGITFVSENQGKIYMFDGKSLVAITDTDPTWFKNNIGVKVDKDYFLATEQKYPFANNPSNFFGSGFISTYDSRKERLIFTKKDRVISSKLLDTDSAICNRNGQLTIFSDIPATISEQAIEGWDYVGIEDCRLKFKKETIRVVKETRLVSVTTTVPNTADVHIFYDISGSFGTQGSLCLQLLDDAVEAWRLNFQAENPSWVGTLYKNYDSSERWLRFPSTIGALRYGGVTADKDIIVISFCNEAAPSYHGNGVTASIVAPTQVFLDDYDQFRSEIIHDYKSFIGINYPIVFGEGASSCGTGGGNLPQSRAFLQHSIAALKGVPMTAEQISSELPIANPGFTTLEWTTMLSSLQGPNPYPDTGLEVYGWRGKWDRNVEADGVVITPLEFQIDMAELLAGSSTTTIEEVIVDVQVIDVEYKYLDGQPLLDVEVLDNSWTASYSLKDKSWISMHSYIPNFYLNVPNDFYSWIHGSNGLWKHNQLGSYQKFYGVRYPFIMEYVSLSNPLVNRTWEYLKLLTIAKRYDPEYEDFVEERFITFNKAIFYNSRQASGLLTLKVKDTQTDAEDYLEQQTVNLDGSTILLDTNEGDWTLNQLRDNRIDYTKPIFSNKLVDRQSNYYIDKILNTSTIDYDKDWSELESFRDKYLVVRLIFDNFDNVKLLLNYSIENELQSPR